MKQYNTVYDLKDKTKVPCIVLLTMENTIVETITRLFDMTIENSRGMQNYALDEVINLLRTEGQLVVNDSSPIDIVIKYKPNKSVDTNYLYTLYDDLKDQGYEMVCLIQDHIKRIRSVDNESDLRIELGAIVNEFKVFAADKDIPFITVSHLNREATRILEEAARKGSQDSGKLLGKSNIGESLLMIDNVDVAATIAKDWDREGNMYMTFNRIKMRGKGSAREYIAQPFLPDNSIRLVEDIGGIPQFKETIHGLPSLPLTSGNIKMDGASSLNSIINTDVNKDNTFNINLTPVSVNNNDNDFNTQMDLFDDDISALVIQNNKEIEAINGINSEHRILPSMDPPVKPIIFVKNPEDLYTCPISFDESLIKMG
jgi:hypothetical protein